MNSLTFSVDAALLRELGERLVGKPHIALAELIKNSYDADATEVVIDFLSDEMVVRDNGTGMAFESFRDFWMRIGSPHKESRATSLLFERPLTGSKGVGRLSVQLLANHLDLRTVAYTGLGDELFASVSWEDAVAAEELTKATALWTERAATGTFPGDKPHGTELVLKGLHQAWSAGDFEDLAREIWDLQPPFSDSSDSTSDFRVTLNAPDAAVSRRFASQMGAILDLWTARLRARLRPDHGAGARRRTVELAFEFAGEEREVVTYDIDACRLESVDFEVRVFNLRDRQPRGIRVGDARDYLNRYGGVHVYDSGFRLPYYGSDTDWLGIEIDHSHRLARSELLPESLQIRNGLSFLPTNSRLFGVVNVNTGLERRAARSEGEEREALAIQVTRDRFFDSSAYRDLVRIVRWSLDYYAMKAAQRAVDEPKPSPGGGASRRVATVEDVLEAHVDEMSAELLTKLQSEIRAALDAMDSEAESITSQAGLLGALATAGMSAIAYEHEAARQLFELGEVVDALPHSAKKAERVALAERLGEWLQRMRSNRMLFSHLLDEANQQDRKVLRAQPVLEQVRRQTEPLLGDLPINIDLVDPALRLPEGTYAEWVALFQNLFVNAANAMLDTPDGLVRVRSEVRGRRRSVYVEDTGTGVDLTAAEELFEPFVRKQEISLHRRSLGLGGSGLGLTIVRMVATRLGCTVAFVGPPEGFSTSARVSWGQ